MKISKKYIASMMAIVFVLSISLNVFASETRAAGYVIQSRRTSGDVLNCHTSGEVTSGTLVSTWSYTGNPSQRWNAVLESNNRYSLRSAASPGVAINANRSYFGTQVNVLSTNNNYIQDYTFTAIPFGTDGYLTMVARAGHTSSVYLKSNGDKAICTWIKAEPETLGTIWSYRN